MTLTRGSFTYASGEEYHGEWKEGKIFLILSHKFVCSVTDSLGPSQLYTYTVLIIST